jgi:hypothetical protein
LTPKERAEQWRAKELHGRFANALNLENSDSMRSTEWIRTAGLLSETKFIFATQDHVINTRSYQKHIIGTNCSDKCRLYKHATESFQHICSGSPALAQKDYLERHNSVAKVVHQALAKRYGLTETEMPYYKCKPEQVLSNDKAELLWDTPIVTDRSVEDNRPDLILFDKKAETAIIVDIAIPMDDSLETTISEKKRKYLQLAVELKDIYKLKSTSIVPLVKSTNALVKKVV